MDYVDVRGTKSPYTHVGSAPDQAKGVGWFITGFNGNEQSKKKKLVQKNLMNQEREFDDDLELSTWQCVPPGGGCGGDSSQPSMQLAGVAR